MVRHLRFLNSGPGGAERVAKPRLELTDWRVDGSGRWVVEVQAEMRNRPKGWSFAPHVVFVGLDGRREKVPWERLEPIDGCEIERSRVVVRPGGEGRLVRAGFRGITDADGHPIPADQAAIDVLAEDLDVAEEVDT
jgi:hypothetical protein